MADPTRLEPDEDLAGLRLREVELLHLERLAEALENGGADLHTPILERRGRLVSAPPP